MTPPLLATHPQAGPVSVDYATADGTAAAADNDYIPASGTLLFAPGETSKVAQVVVVGDARAEADEAFIKTLILSVRSPPRVLLSLCSLHDRRESVVFVLVERKR